MAAPYPPDGWVYLGNGPAATGGGPHSGWRALPELYGRCVLCGGLVSLDPHGPSGSCECGALHKDVDAARFGSRLGDAAIEIYRAP